MTKRDSMYITIVLRLSILSRQNPYSVGWYRLDLDRFVVGRGRVLHLFGIGADLKGALDLKAPWSRARTRKFLKQ